MATNRMMGAAHVLMYGGQTLQCKGKPSDQFILKAEIEARPLGQLVGLKMDHEAMQASLQRVLRALDAFPELPSLPGLSDTFSGQPQLQGTFLETTPTN